MTLRFIALLTILAACVLHGDGVRAAGCDPDGNVKYICGMISPEDLVAVPGGNWVVASGYTAGGGLHLINTRDYTTRQLFPTANPKLRADTNAYSACPGPLDPAEKEKFSAHGLSLRPGSNGVHTLYMVHHGFRESVEVFELDAKSATPTLTWVGCAVLPEAVGINSVTALPEGGFAVTNPFRRGGGGSNPRESLMTGANTGQVWEWNPKDGWKVVPGSESPGPNGIEVSKDGKWLYVNLWNASKVMRLSRGQTPAKTDVVDVPFHPDNIRWQSDGSLYTAGQGAPTFPRVLECLSKFCADATTNVWRIDPQTLKAESVVHDTNKQNFVSSTTGLRVGNEIWIGTSHSDRIARYPIQ
jgi:hypothetical protein